MSFIQTLTARILQLIGFIDLAPEASPALPPVSVDGQARIALDPADDTVKLSEDAGAFFNLSGIIHVIGDPGDGVAVPVTRQGAVPLAIAGAGETNTLDDPTYAGQLMMIYVNTLAGGGDRAITADNAINQNGDTIMTFAAERDWILLTGITQGANIRWQVVGNDGTALS